MTTITLHELDDGVADALRERAAEHGCSIEQEACAILRDAVNGGVEAAPEERAVPGNLGTAMHEAFRPFHGIDLPIPPRKPMEWPKPLFSE